jgi:hypothetical protein
MRRHNSINKKFTVEHMWLVFDHLIAGRPVIYYSCPVSTGKRFINWWQDSGHELPHNSAEYNLGLLEQVIRPNLADARTMFRAITAYNHSDTSHISPAELDLAAWSHDECMRFWLRFFEQQIISELVCLSDWSYSLGCVMEYHAARKYNLPVRETDNCIHPAKLLADMANCMELMQRAGIDFARYQEEYNQLQQLLA